MRTARVTLVAAHAVGEQLPGVHGMGVQGHLDVQFGFFPTTRWA